MWDRNHNHIRFNTEMVELDVAWGPWAQKAQVAQLHCSRWKKTVNLKQRVRQRWTVCGVANKREDLLGCSFSLNESVKLWHLVATTPVTSRGKKKIL